MQRNDSHFFKLLFLFVLLLPLLGAAAEKRSVAFLESFDEPPFTINDKALKRGYIYELAELVLQKAQYNVNYIGGLQTMLKNFKHFKTVRVIFSSTLIQRAPPRTICS